jgi:starch synthase
MPAGVPALPALTLIMADNPLKILMVASEATPFAKTGGLADVAGSLPPALQDLGHHVLFVMPWYRQVRRVTGNLRPSRRPLRVPFGGRVADIRYRRTDRQGLEVCFIDAPEYYDRPELYGERGIDYPDNAERFGLFSRAALELARERDFVPDVIHAHDWQTGLIPVYLRQQLWQDPFFTRCGTLFTIHNLGYHGSFPVETLRLLGLDATLAAVDGLEYHGRISLLKGGIRFADQVSTVSPTYCREIQTPAQGMGLDGLLHSRSADLHGILNGLDPRYWNPAEDPALAAPYDATDPSGKVICKQALQEELGLPVAPDRPLLSMITRLDPQKGIDLVLEAWDRLMTRDAQLVILGTGSPEFERRLSECSAYYPEQSRVLLRFDDALSRRIYAASDLFLMPSRYEPCGLGQLIALRYGSIPLVHATGGLADTIIDPDQNPARANGFVFNGYHHSALLSGLDRALNTYRNKIEWTELRLHGMQQDLSWAKAAREYVNLYRICRKEAA